MIIDYKNAVKELIKETYGPADLASKEIEKTTVELVQSFRNVLPQKVVDEHLVYEALIELGYKPKEKEPLIFMWYFKRK